MNHQQLYEALAAVNLAASVVMLVLLVGARKRREAAYRRGHAAGQLAVIERLSAKAKWLGDLAERAEESGDLGAALRLTIRGRELLEFVGREIK